MSQHGESSSASQGTRQKWKLREEVSIITVIARTNLPTPACHPSTCCLLNLCGKNCSVKAGHQNESLFSYNRTCKTITNEECRKYVWGGCPKWAENRSWSLSRPEGHLSSSTLKNRGNSRSKKHGGKKKKKQTRGTYKVQWLSVWFKCSEC